MKVLYGISGGIAAYKAPELVRALRRNGHVVRCVLTDNGARLVSKHALATVSGHAVADSMWAETGAIEHIDLARWCDAMLVAPATADLIARFALGLADDLLTTLHLALEPDKPVWIAPAMNTQMWEKPVVQGHVAALVDRGVRLIGPVAGDLACGEKGVGAMAAPDAIVAAVK